ncbi:crossover junction endonuclease MUS81-like [Amphiura filiformis]|uniref:crossover junction endonuclease MUS81-like n=1 Tax=Amphiura filiformis TaxID=82378 RepID=UPI003B21676F
MASAPKVKRKKKLDTCPNPLFVQWLTEWRDEAADKGIKTQYAYGKALRSLKCYPLPLKSGKEAKILDNFGDKICKMLDKKLENYIAEHGELPDPMASFYGENDPPLPSLGGLPNIIDDGMPTIPPPPPQDETVKEKPKRKAAKRTPREYVPVYRSGPYAIILTLYRNHIKPGSRGYMTKVELQREAQPLSEKSFTLPEPGSHYTAWSSMGNLISKNYITKEGSPAKYIITEAGCELAHKLETVEAQNQLNQSTSPPHINGRTTAIGGSSGSDSDTYTRPSQSSNRVPPLPSISIAPDSRPTAPHTISKPPDRLEYWYIDDRGHEVHSKDAAAVLIDDVLSIGFLIKCQRQALVQSVLRYKLDTSKSTSNGQVYAYIHNDDAEEFCPVPTKPQAYNSTSTSFPSSSSYASLNPSSSTISSSSPSGNTASSSHTLSRLSSFDDDNTKPYRPAAAPSNGSYPHTNVRTQYSEDSQHSVASSVGTMNSQASSSTSNVLKEPPKPIYVMRPGTFEIVLCVDNCETKGGSNKPTRKDLLLPELQKNGVNLDVRKLQVGDFLWIARERRVPVPGMLQMPTGRELVLDYVVERKRMDDLCGSIMDGRFHEQKFRMKQCGLRKPIYLVEEFGSIDHLSIPAPSLRQAAINTQVVNGFFVKNTRDQKESVAYLTVMTRYLQAYYANKTLEAYQKDDLDTLGKADTNLTGDVQQLMTFKEFNDCSIKNKETTVFETFAKQLLQFAGLSAEKAVAITNVYKTPASLLDAYASCALEKDKEKLLARLKCGSTQRNLGPALSKLVYQLYCTEGALK